jgi:hypothetical protein
MYTAKVPAFTSSLNGMSVSVLKNGYGMVQNGCDAELQVGNVEEARQRKARGGAPHPLKGARRRRTPGNQQTDWYHTFSNWRRIRRLFGIYGVVYINIGRSTTDIHESNHTYKQENRTQASLEDESAYLARERNHEIQACWRWTRRPEMNTDGANLKNAAVGGVVL